MTLIWTNSSIPLQLRVCIDILDIMDKPIRVHHSLSMNYAGAILDLYRALLIRLHKNNRT